MSVNNISHPKWGPGIAVRAHYPVALVASDGVAANSDTTIPFTKLSISSNDFNFGGFVTVAGNNYSGLWMNPNLLGPRMNREAANWQQWRARGINATYVPLCATTTVGSLMMAFSHDPSAFIEANSQTSNQTAPKPNAPSLVQTSPSAQIGLFSGAAIGTTNFDDRLYDCEVASQVTGAYEYHNDLATVAYDRQHYCGRIAGLLYGQAPANSAATYGTIWVTADLEFYHPTSCSITVGNSYLTNLALDGHFKGPAMVRTSDGKVLKQCFDSKHQTYRPAEFNHDPIRLGKTLLRQAESRDRKSQDSVGVEDWEVESVRLSDEAHERAILTPREARVNGKTVYR